LRMDLALEYINRSIEFIKSERQKRTNEMILRHTDKMVWLGILGSKILHSSRNAITYIKGNIDNLRNYYLPLKEAAEYYLKNSDNEKQKKKLEFIISDYTKLLDCMQKGAEKLILIAETLGQLNANEPTTVPTAEISVDTLILATIELINYFRKSYITINYNKPKDKDLKILGKQTELELAIMNILLNAVYACENIPDALIEIESLLKDDKINILISHNGMAIPTENLEEIFNPLSVAHFKNKQYWIGLSVSKKIITQHNGEIRVKQLQDKTEFTIEFKIS